MSVSDFLHSFWLTKLAFGVEKAVVAWQVETRNEGHDKKEKKSRVKREEMLAGMTSLAMTWNCIWMVPQSPSLVRVWLPLLTPLEDFLGKNGSNMLLLCCFWKYTVKRYIQPLHVLSHCEMPVGVLIDLSHCSLSDRPITVTVLVVECSAWWDEIFTALPVPPVTDIAGSTLVLQLQSWLGVSFFSRQL